MLNKILSRVSSFPAAKEKNFESYSIGVKVSAVQGILRSIQVRVDGTCEDMDLIHDA